MAIAGMRRACLAPPCAPPPPATAKYSDFDVSSRLPACRPLRESTACRIKSRLRPFGNPPESGSRADYMIQQIQLLFGRTPWTPVQPFFDAIPIAKKKMVAARSRSESQTRAISRCRPSDQIPAPASSCRRLRRLRLSLQPGRESSAAKLIDVAYWPHARSNPDDVQGDGNPRSNSETPGI